MENTVQAVLDAFRRLSETEQRLVAGEILIRTREPELPHLDEHTIDRIADASFLERDARKPADGGP